MRKKIKSSMFLSVIITILLITAIQMVYASTKEPGSIEDPIVTWSYVELKIDQLKDYIDQKISSSNNTKPDPSEKNATFEVVELKPGERLTGKAGSEIILRSGQAKAVASINGGLSDVTGAKDLKTDEKIPLNHLLIIPRDDKRGVEALEHSFLLVKGGYTIN